MNTDNISLQVFIGLTWFCVMFWIWSLPKKVPFRLKLHPTLMFTAYFLLFFEAYVAYRIPEYDNLNNEEKIKLHASLNTVALVIGLIGVAVLFTEPGRVHLYSVHSWIGAISNMLYFINVILGYLSRKNKIDIRWHKFMGHFLFLLMCVALLSGIQNLTSIMIRTLGFQKRSKYVTASIGITILFIVTVFLEKYQHDELSNGNISNDELSFKQIQTKYKKNKNALVVIIDDIWDGTDKQYLVDVTKWNEGGPNQHPGGSQFGIYKIPTTITAFESNNNITNIIKNIPQHNAFDKSSLFYRKLQDLIIGVYKPEL